MVRCPKYKLAVQHHLAGRRNLTVVGDEQPAGVSGVGGMSTSGEAAAASPDADLELADLVRILNLVGGATELNRCYCKYEPPPLQEQRLSGLPNRKTRLPARYRDVLPPPSPAITPRL